jgi:DnaK suppressor protein
VASSDTQAAVAALRKLALVRAHPGGVIADLESDSAAIAEATAEGPDDEHDAEGSTVGYERARVGGLLARARLELADLDEAAARLASGTYQRCETCGGDIGEARLEALPTTRRCVSCATREGGRTLRNGPQTLRGRKIFPAAVP